MKKIIALLLSLCMMTAIFAGCGESGKNETADAKSTTSTPAQSTLAKAGEFPMSVKDANGFEVKIDKKPEKIISLTLGTDEMLLSLVDASRIKALTNFSDKAEVSNVVEEAKKVSLRATSGEIENIIAMQPDLVFVDTWAKPEFVKQLRESKITVYVFKTPSNIDEQKKVISEIAHVVGEDEKGKELISWMDGKLKAVEDRLKNLRPEDKLTILDYSEMGTTSAKGTNFDDIMARAGLINAATQAGMEGWPELSKEKIVEMNPDILMLPGWFYDQKNNIESFKKTILEDKSLAGVKAVKNGKLMVVPYPHLTAISQYVVLGVEDTAKAAYPELFK